MAAVLATCEASLARVGDCSGNVPHPLTGVDLLHRFAQRKVFSTGEAAVDRLLSGGLKQGAILELCSVPGAGATRCWMAWMARLLKQDRLAHLYVLESARSFPLVQLAAMADSSEQVMTRVRVVKCQDALDLLHGLEQVEQCLGGVVFVVVEQLPSLLAGIRESRRRITGEVTGLLRRIAGGGGHVITTNYVSSTDNKAGLGRIWAVTPHRQLWITPRPGGLRLESRDRQPVAGVELRWAAQGLEAVGVAGAPAGLGSSQGAGQQSSPLRQAGPQHGSPMVQGGPQQGSPMMQGGPQQGSPMMQGGPHQHSVYANCSQQQVQ